MSFILQSIIVSSFMLWAFSMSLCTPLNVPRGRIRWRLNFTAQRYGCTASRMCSALEKRLLRFSGFSNGKSRARIMFDFLVFAVCSILSLKDTLKTPFSIPDMGLKTFALADFGNLSFLKSLNVILILF